jgi:hypothetical protein
MPALSADPDHADHTHQQHHQEERTMSNGYYRFACIDTDDAHIVADEGGYGSYPEITVSLFPTETADRSAVQEIHLTHEQWAELLQQWNEYREIAAADSAAHPLRPGTADELPF